MGNDTYSPADSQRGGGAEAGHLRAIERLARIGGWELDSEDSRLRCSHQALALFGLPAGEAPTFTSLAAVMSGQSIAAFRAAIQRCLADGSAFELQLTRSGDDGATATLDVMGHGETRPDGSRYVLGTIQDLTAQRHAAEALAASEEKFRLLAANLPGTVYLCRNDARYTMLYMSENMEALIGFPASMFLEDAMCFLDIVHPDDADMVYSKVGAALAERRSYQLTYRMRHQNGSWRWVREIGVGVFDSGELTHLEGFLMDVTEQRDLEAQLRQSQKMESIGQLAGGIAHDFNNLLSAIIGHAELTLLDSSLSEQTRLSLSHIREAGTRAASLTQQLLVFASRQAIAPRDFYVNEKLRSMQAFVSRLLGERVQLVMELTSDAGAVRADPSQFEQVILNLAINAGDAMAGGGRITIATRRLTIGPLDLPQGTGQTAGDYVCLTVTDTGSGMTPEVQARIFEPFFSTKSKASGGLGLATCFGIVKQHDGHIEVSSTVGVGTQFDVYWPAARDSAAAASPTTDAGSAPAVDRDIPTGTATILLVEDEAIVRDVVVQLLQTCGYQVITADSGAAAMAAHAAHDGHIDLLISDMVMPGMTGDELARQLRELRPGLRVLFVSGYAEPQADATQSPHATAFLQKPFDLHVLAQAVEDLLAT